MKKIKIVAMLIVSLFFGSVIASMGGAVKLEGDINAKVMGFSGRVLPGINISNQSVEFLVSVDGTGEPKNYTVNDTLEIDLIIQDETDREIFILPRYVICRVVVARDFSDAMDEPDRFLTNLLPIKATPFKALKVVESLLSGENDTKISMEAIYKISEETFNSGETLTMYVTVMGMIPEDVDGIFDESIGRIIGREIITLDVTYIDETA